MRPEAPALASLSAVVQHDLAAIRRMDADLQGVTPALRDTPGDFRDGAAAGYLLHNIYNALENVFAQISRTFENHVTDPARWHTELLDKMFLDIPGVRPAVLPESGRKIAHDLRGFRHLFRHSYDYQIDQQRIAELAGNWTGSQSEFLAALERFRDYLLNAAGQTGRS